MPIREPHEYPGRLIVVEGIDGSGKSTSSPCCRRSCSRRATTCRSPSGTRRPGEGHHQARQEEEPLHPHHLLADPRHRLRRPPRTLHPAAAAGRADRAGRPLGVHRLRPRRGARLRPRLAAQPVRIRDTPRPLSLLPRGHRHLGGAHHGRPACSSSTTRPAWTWGCRPTRSRASGSSRARCSRSTTRSATSSA